MILCMQKRTMHYFYAQQICSRLNCKNVFATGKTILLSISTTFSFILFLLLFVFYLPLYNTYRFIHFGMVTLFLNIKILTASVWMGWTANISPAANAKLSRRPATIIQTRVNSMQTMACIKIFVKWNQIGFNPNK